MIISVKSHKFWRSDLIMMWLNVTLCVAYDWRWNCKSVVCAERREQATRLCVITCYLITRTLREVTFAHLVKPAQELNRLDAVCTAGVYVPGNLHLFKLKIHQNANVSYFVDVSVSVRDFIRRRSWYQLVLPVLGTTRTW